MAQCFGEAKSYLILFPRATRGITPKQFTQTADPEMEMSNEKNLGWLGYTGDYTTQLYRDYNKPL